MNINKPISNPNLVNIISEMKQGKKKEELFWEEIFRAKFLCPINANLRKESQKKHRKIVLEEGKNIALLSLDNENGEHFLMAFTDWDELKKWKQIDEQQALILEYEDYQEIVNKNNLVCQGMVINPFGENIVLNSKILSDTRKKEQIVKKKENVMLGFPKEYPIDMVNKLKEYFVITQIVDKAYLLWMVRGKEASYLLVLDADISPELLIPSIGQICKPFLGEKLLDIVFANSGLGKEAIAGHNPFFVKK